MKKLIILLLILAMPALRADIRLSVLMGNTDKVREYLNAGESAQQRDAYNYSLLHLAQKPEMIDLLMNYGAYVHACDKFGDTPLHLRARNKQYACVDRLLAHGANHTIINLHKEPAMNKAQICKLRAWKRKAV